MLKKPRIFCRYKQITDVGRLHTVAIAPKDIPVARAQLQKLTAGRRRRVRWDILTTPKSSFEISHGTVVWYRFGKHFGISLAGEPYRLTAEKLDVILCMLDGAEANDPPEKRLHVEIDVSEDFSLRTLDADELP